MRKGYKKVSSCQAAECAETKIYGYGYCRKHYNKFKKYGQPEPPVKPVKVKGLCSAGCGRTEKALGLCGTHYLRQHLTGDVGPVEIKRYRTDGTIGYHQMHRLVVAARGKAEEGTCTDCGLEARHWALMFDANEIIRDAGSGRFYSLNIWAYQRMCYSCHFKSDIAQGLSVGPWGKS